MKETRIKIEGMMCGMCEAHVCDMIRKAVPGAKKVSASRCRGEAVLRTDGEVDAEALKRAVEAAGYSCLLVTTEEYNGKGLFGRR